MKKIALFCCVCFSLSLPVVAEEAQNLKETVVFDLAPIDNEAIKSALSALDDKQAKYVISNPLELENFINATIKRRALAAEAVKQGVSLTELKSLREKVQNFYEAQLADLIRTQHADSLEFPNMDALIKEKYLANRDGYKVKPAAEASHILLKYTSLEEKAEKEALLLDIKQRIEKGESFADLAKEYSDDAGSATKGGSLGKFTQGRMVKPFEEAVFSLSPGELSDVVETRFGLHLIQLHAKEPARVQTLEEVRSQLEFKARNDYIAASIANWERDIIANSGSQVDISELLDFLNAKLGLQQ